MKRISTLQKRDKSSKKNDRLISGGIAGAIGGLIQIIFEQTAKALGITDRAFIDFSKVLIMFKPYNGLTAFIVGFISQIIIAIIFGVIFGYIIQLTSSRYYVIKGIGFGAAIWCILLGFGTIFSLPLFKDIPPNASLSAFVGSLIYGFITAYALKVIDNKTDLL